MVIPNWKDAPPWAMWLAQDRDWRWWWFERKPKYNETMGAWFGGYGRFEYAGMGAYHPVNFAVTLEARP